MKETNNFAYRSIALLGYRKKGKELYQNLSQKGIKIPYIIERNYQALSILEVDLDTPIVGFQMSNEFYHQAEAILLTGDLPEMVVREILELTGIDIPLITSVEVENVSKLRN